MTANNNYRLDFQEAVLELVNAYISSAETEINGKRYRIIYKHRKIYFQYEADSGRKGKAWFSILPFTELYLVKWSAVA